MIRLALPLLLLVALAGSASAGDPPGTKTPEEFFKLYQGCYDVKLKLFDYAKLYDISTPESQTLLFMRASQEAMAATRDEEWKVLPERQKALDALIRKFGLDPAQKPLEGGPDMDDAKAKALFMEPQKMVAHLKTLLKPVKDKAGLIKSLFRFAYAQASEHSDLRPTEVKTLEVKGDRASGRALSELKTPKESMSQDAPYFLKKVKGTWRYDLVAVFEDMVSHMKKRD